MTDLAWSATRTDTIDRFQGQTPRPEDEANIIDVFEQHPQLVLRAIDETADALTNGKITWAWSVLSARLARGSTPLREATADTSHERTRRIHNAETWIHNTGIHYDREDQVLAELFGDEYARGPLTDYAADQKLRARLLELWRLERPRGEQAEAASEEWNAQCGAHHKAMLERRTKPQPEPEPATITTDPDADINLD